MSEIIIIAIIQCTTVMICVGMVIGLGLYAVYKTGGNVSVEGEKGGAVKTGKFAE